MKLLQNILSAIQKIGLRLGPHVLTFLQYGLPLLITAGAIVYVWWSKRAAKKAGAAPVVPKGAEAPTAVAGLSPGQLRRAWLRFVGQLSPLYQRSILSFTHFVVLGAASSGKSRVVDTYTDWRQQLRQFAGAESRDPDLEVCMGSAGVVMTLPATVLADHSERCRKALLRLWRPLYRRRSPTVVVVVDAAKLKESTADLIQDLAHTIRGKINTLSSVRKRPVEVRVVVTRLDEIDGFLQFATFLRERGLSSRIPIAIGPGQEAIRQQLGAWFESSRGHLPLALVTLPATDFRRALAFLERAPEVCPPLGAFLESLFGHEPVSRDPSCGGVFLASDPPGAPNPLQATEAEPPPDPRVRHLVFAAAGAAVVLGCMVVEFVSQHSSWSSAMAARGRYDAAEDGTSTDVGMQERALRVQMEQFASGTGSLLERPDFFSGRRAAMRDELSQTIRNKLLIPGLRQVAQYGTTGEAGPEQSRSVPLPIRRSLYYLALIHSDHADRMGIETHLRTWSEMTGLRQDLIVDYLSTTKDAWKNEVSFELPESNGSDVDDADRLDTWRDFLRRVGRQLASSDVVPSEVAALRAEASDKLHALQQIDHDDLTMSILERLDDAAGTPRGRLQSAYRPRYDRFFATPKLSDAQRIELEKVLRAIAETSVESKDSALLRELDERLTALNDSAADPGQDEQVDLADMDFKFSTRQWRDVVRKAAMIDDVDRFVRGTEKTSSIFFAPGDDRNLSDIGWNTSNNGSALFVGKATLAGRYTRATYDASVRSVVERLSDALSKAGSAIPDDRKTALADVVRSQVRQYAQAYRAEVEHFFRSYSLRTPSSEALRVALSQMVADSSPFADFVSIVEQNTNVTASDPLLQPMQEQMGDFDAWHRAFDPASGAPEMAKYKAILQQLLADLGPEEAVGAKASPQDAADAQGPNTLEKELSPAGRLVLTDLQGNKGSYAGLVSTWLASVELPDYQGAPFRAPIVQLTTVGARDIEHMVARTWERDMAPDFQHVADRFPFDRRAAEDASPGELTDLFHPQTGRFFDVFRRYIEPIAEFGNGGPFRERRSMRGVIAVPAPLFPAINAAAALSATLWDQKTGAPKRLEYRIATVPFEHGTDPMSALTLVYLSVGDSKVFNFNQKPSITTIDIDWTKEQDAQVGVQLTDLETMDNLFPQPVVAQGSCWSLQRLLERAEVSHVKQPASALLYTWSIAGANGEPDGIRARFVMMDDAWSAFSLGSALGSAGSRRTAVR